MTNFYFKGNSCIEFRHTLFLFSAIQLLKWVTDSHSVSPNWTEPFKVPGVLSTLLMFVFKSTYNILQVYPMSVACKFWWRILNENIVNLQMKSHIPSKHMLKIISTNIFLLQLLFFFCTVHSYWLLISVHLTLVSNTETWMSLYFC